MSRKEYLTFHYSKDELEPVDEGMVDFLSDFDDPMGEARRASVAAMQVFYAIKDMVQADRDARALEMLQGGASYIETAATVGGARHSWVHKFPGYGLTPTEAGQLGVTVRKAGMQRPTRLR